MRLTLIFPSVGRKENTPYVRAWQMQPLSMALLASLTPPEIDLRFYDDRLDDIPFDEPTDLVALSVETFTALRAYRIARQFRARGVPVVLGGYHVTLLPEEARQEADALVLGDAEVVWRELLDDARQRRLQPVYDGRGRRSLAGLRPRGVGQPQKPAVAQIVNAQRREELGVRTGGCRIVLREFPMRDSDDP